MCDTINFLQSLPRDTIIRATLLLGSEEQIVMAAPEFDKKKCVATAMKFFAENGWPFRTCFTVGIIKSVKK